LVAAALVACGGASSNQVNVGGRISYLTLEGGVWTIRADDGVTYEPRSLAVEFKKDNLSVFATLVVRADLGSIHMVGPVVDVLNIEVMPAFAGAWRGRKDYLADDGKVVAWADWVFQIRMTGREALKFVNGPPARITGPSTFAVSSFVYPPSYPPGPSGGMCVPITDTITDGAGMLAQDGSLSLALNWTHSCGGQTSRSTTRYSMKPAALASYEISQL
jgi:hypothetical protein